ncbi:hypothetical protein QTP70_024767 [Hemibagrus guttatus]|uniref:Immunoglobulin domain-containing protein n=1 Tax=Hemibagrus guttatus TaxID=175788 RepID=A0AAE0QF87_9TELE|nr:hypothetical protein QTP70_024767 [Hemibagrus guttatus]
MMKSLLIFTLSLISDIDSCCAGSKTEHAFPGQNISIISNYPVVYDRDYKYIMKLDNDSILNGILDTHAQSQNKRFSISDDRNAKALSLSISNVTEADDGIYLCGVYDRMNSVQHYSFFTEIQLHVRGLTLSSKDNEQVHPGPCIYEEIDQTTNVAATDTELYMNAPSHSPDTEIFSTVPPPQEQNLTYTTVNFQKNPDDAAVTFSKEECTTEYATVQHTSTVE